MELETDKLIWVKISPGKDQHRGNSKIKRILPRLIYKYNAIPDKINSRLFLNKVSWALGHSIDIV
jgi:hypothetical protein